MNNYKWIVDRLKLSYGEVKQIGSEVIYIHKSGGQSKINIDINKLAEVAKEIEEHQYNGGQPRKRRAPMMYKPRKGKP